MLLQRLRWLLPVLIISWTNLLQLSGALPAHDERGLYKFANTPNPSVATSTITRQDYNKRVQSQDGKNDTQSNHKLVASPAGLLRPDKFQFYTYNDKGDMITRQMTAQEIQGLIAAGGADHVAMDKQEAQKADDVLTGGKKVMDVVQKVQNVLKSALDKPPALTGSMPKIPEHANVEWSNILPSILSGETDAISSINESNQSLYKLTTERVEVKSSTVGYSSSAESALNTGTSATTSSGKKPTAQSDIQTNAYAGFTNNMEHGEKPQYIHHSQQNLPNIFTEKPMIPVPVITLTEQKLSTLRSSITESPIFQMLSVIPVEAVQNAYNKEDQTVSTATVELSTQTENSFNQTEQFIELTLSKAPEDSTISQPTGLDIYPINITKQTDAGFANKVSQEIGIPAVTHSMPTPSVSTISSVTNSEQAVTYSGFNEATNTIGAILSSNTYYIPIHNKNNTDPSEDISFVPGVTKVPRANETHNVDEIISHTDITTSIPPLSHASVVLRPEEASNETTLRSPSTFVSRIETSTITTLPYMNRPGEDSSIIITRESINSVTPTYAGHHVKPQTIKIQSSEPIESLSTQLIDSFSSVMNQISEAKPSVLSLSSTPVGVPQMSIVNVDIDPIKITTQYDTFTSHNANKEDIERVINTQTYATITKSPSQNTITTRITAASGATATDRESSTSSMIKDIPVKPSTWTTIGAISNKVTANNLVTTSFRPNVKPTDAMFSESATPLWIQFEKIHDVSPKNKSEISAIPEIATVTTAALEKYTHDGASFLEDMSSGTSTIFDAAKTQSIGTGGSSTTPINEYSDNILIRLNWSDPVSAIDQVLSTAALPSRTPPVRPISLPSDTSNFLASELASGLIAGFATSVPAKPTFEENQIAKNISSTYTIRPTKPTEVIKNVTQIYKEATKLNINKNQQKKGNVTQTSTQKPYLTGSTPLQGSTLKINTQAEKSNNASSTVINKDDLPRETEKITDLKSKYGSGATSSSENILMKESIKLSTNERIDDTTDGFSLSSLPNKFVGISSESKDSTEQSIIITPIVTMNPGQLSTIDNIQVSNTKETLLDTSYEQKKKEDGERRKTTEASVIRTDINPELSRLPIKIPLIDSVNNIGNAANIAKTETLKGEKNNSSANISSGTQEITASKDQYQNIPGYVAATADDSISHSSSEHRNDNIAIGVDASNAMLNTPLDGDYKDAALLQNTSHASSVTNIDKNKGNSTITLIMPYTVAPTSRTPIDNKDSDSINFSSSSSPSSIQDATKIITSESSGETIDNKEELPRPILINDSNVTNNILNQNNKDALQAISNSNSELLTEKATLQTNAQSNKTEDKPVSWKHSENPTKPEIIHLQLSTLPPSEVSLHQSASKPTFVGHKPSEKPDISKVDANVNAENKWTLISQQTPPAMTKLPKPSKPPRKPIQGSFSADENVNVRLPGAEMAAHHQQDDQPQIQPVLPLDASQSASGLDITVKHTSADIVNFAKLCNELAFNFWVATNKGLSTARSLALSPFGMTSLLAMIFLGARGPTSDQMNEVLGLDDVATFNPHLVFQNITDTVSLVRGHGIANAAFVRELFADKMKVRKLMPFYKEQAQQFYEGLVTEVNFATISDLVRRRTNLLIRKQTGGRIKDFVKTNTVPLRSPLAALSANVFQTDCNTSLTSSVGRDGELYFAVSPAVRQRRLIPVPATTWRSGVLAGYEPSIDATAVALGSSDKLVSTIFVLPGQQGHTAPGDNLDRLEQRLVRSAFRDGTWNKLLKILIPRSGLELQVPKFSHRSVVNATAALKRMGLDELFSGNADLKGINGIGHRLHLADVLQMNLFSTCGDENILSGRHHVETYPASPVRSIRRRIEDIDSPGDVMEDDLSRHDDVLSQGDRSYTDGYYKEERQLSTMPEKPRLKLDRPFLYFVRHNPSGIILHMGRFNPRLLP